MRGCQVKRSGQARAGKDHAAEPALLEKIHQPTDGLPVVADHVKKVRASVADNEDVARLGRLGELPRRAEPGLRQEPRGINRFADRRESVIAHKQDVRGFANAIFVKRVEKAGEQLVIFPERGQRRRAAGLGIVLGVVRVAQPQKAQLRDPVHPELLEQDIHCPGVLRDIRKCRLFRKLA